MHAQNKLGALSMAVEEGLFTNVADIPGEPFARLKTLEYPRGVPLRTHLLWSTRALRLILALLRQLVADPDVHPRVVATKEFVVF